MEGPSGEEKDSKRAREKEKREEREALLKECQGKGGYYSEKFLEKGKWKTNKAPKALKDKRVSSIKKKQPWQKFHENTLS